MSTYVWRTENQEDDKKATYELFEQEYDELIETEWKCVVQPKTHQQYWWVMGPDRKYLRNAVTGNRTCGHLHSMMRLAIDRMKQELAGAMNGR